MSSGAFRCFQVPQEGIAIMKKMLLAGTALLTLVSGPAMAADLSPAPPPATARATCPLTLPDLVAAFTTVPDPRRRQGRRFPLAALLTLTLGRRPSSPPVKTTPEGETQAQPAA